MGFRGNSVVTCLHAIFGYDLPRVLGEAANVEGPWEAQRSGFWNFRDYHSNP